MSETIQSKTAMKSQPRLMPNPWFQGQSSNRTIGELIREPHKDDLRPLRDGERFLGKFILPPFQRPAVWTLEQQVKLLESIWDGLPIGAYVWNEVEDPRDTDGWLLDGQQRMGALLAYVKGLFPVYGYRYSDLQRHEQRRFENKGIAGIQTRVASVQRCRVIYNRLAYGGTPHKPCSD